MGARPVENIVGVEVSTTTVKVTKWGQKVVQKADSKEFVPLADLARKVMKATPKEAKKLEKLYVFADHKTGFFMRIFSAVRSFFFAHNLRSKVTKMNPESVDHIELTEMPKTGTKIGSTYWERQIFSTPGPVIHSDLLKNAARMDAALEELSYTRVATYQERPKDDTTFEPVEFDSEIIVTEVALKDQDGKEVTHIEV